MIDPAIQTAVARLSPSKHGRLLTPEAAMRLRDALPGLVPGWYIELLSRFPLAGTCLTYKTGERDVELQWAGADIILSEALEAYPGCAVRQLGYIPLATCPAGSGNPYFIRVGDSSNPPVLQIYHDMVAIAPGGILRPDSHRRIAGSLSELLTGAQVLVS